MQSLIRDSSFCVRGVAHEAAAVRTRKVYRPTPARWHTIPCPLAHTSLAAHAGMPDRDWLSGGDDYSFSLTQFMVVLDKPIGLTLAPDPTTGEVYVQHIQQGMAAADSRLILVGDRLLSCSAVFGDEMWSATDLQRTRWAINNRPGKVKLVLERGSGRVPPWYFRGREGIASWEVPELQLPIRFTTSVGGELTESLPGVGRSMTVSFNRCMNPSTAEQVIHPLVRPGLQARLHRAELLLEQLIEASASPEVDVSSPVTRLLAGKDAARFQVSGGSTPLPAGGTTNVLPFRRSSNSGGNTPNPNNSNSNSSSSSSGALGSNSSSPLAGGNNSNSLPGQNSTNSTASNSGSSAAVMGPQSGSGTAGEAGNSSCSNGGSSKPPGSTASSAAAAAAAAAWGGSAAAGGGSGGLGSAAAIPQRDKRVVQVLPWLLVSNGRLNVHELTRLSTSRALGCLLEMRLTVTQQGLLCPIGSQPPEFSLPAAPVPPTLSPSTTPTPAPENPPPYPAAAQQEQQQEQQQQDQQQQQQSAAVSADLLGIAGPDVGFASAAATAAAVAAAAAGEPAAAAAGGGSTSSSSGSSNSLEPSPSTLQAHAILHCMADLHRLAVRRQWTPKAGTGWAKHGQQPSEVPPPPTLGVLGGLAALQGSTMGSSSGSGLGHSSSSGSSGSSSSSGLGGTAAAAAGGFQQQQVHSSQLLLSCDEGSWGLVGLVLVSWLTWHCGVDQPTAIESVSKSLGVTLDPAVLSEVRRLLVVRAKERFSRLMLAWPYGGLSAEVSGELVGGWTERVAMARCMKPEGCHRASKGHFFLELKGLHPGRYHYKFIIDNTWDIDPAAPKTLDSQGNWNNVLDVKQPPRIETPEQEAHFATLQAMCSAFDRKLRPVGSLF